MVSASSAAHEEHEDRRDLQLCLPDRPPFTAPRTSGAQEVQMSQNYSGGKRQREAEKARKRKEKEERLARNRAMRAQGLDLDEPTEADAAAMLEASRLPEVKLEDIQIGVARQPRGNTVGPTRLFVGGLSWDTTSDTLRAAFAKFGPVSEATVITDRATGRSRGFGFVTFDDTVAATAALKGMNGAELDGRNIKVNPAERR
jgi:RNA recognition motif-containing protein